LPSVFKFIGISLDNKRCINCLKCDEECTMGVLDVENQSGLRWNSECILCLTCQDTCPVNAIKACL
jgi:NAD-dependent dihydropyrimidine dehydrogenase PreA subunit